MHKVYLSLGSNLGDKQQNLRNAINEINNRIGLVTGQSDFICTEPYGFVSENQFVNAAILVETDLTPQEILDITQNIEKDLGRTNKSKNGIYHDRIIDVDILLYDDLQLYSRNLNIPHLHMKEREFVLLPLSQINPDLIIPGETQTIKELLAHICTS